MIKKSPLINTVRRKSLVVYALNERANVFQLLGNYEEAEKDYYRMLKILPTTQNRLLFYTGLSDLCLEAGKIEDAYNSIQKALYLSRKNKLILEHIKGLLSFSHILRKMGFYKKSIKALAEAKCLLKRYPKLSKEIEKEALDVAEGIVHCLLGRYDKGLMFFKKALKIARGKNNLRKVSFILNDIGNIYSERGILKKALNYYNQGLRVAEKIQDRPAMIDFLYSIASILARQHSYKKAMECVNKTLEISRDINSLDGMYYNLFAKGTLLTSLGKFDEAIKAYRKSLNLFKITKDPLVKIENLVNIGRIYLMRGWYRKCINFFDRAEALAREIENPYSISIVLNYKTKYFMEIGCPKKALKCLKESYELTRKHKILNQYVECLILFVELIIKHEKVHTYTIMDARKFINQALLLTRRSKEFVFEILPVYIKYKLKIKDYKNALRQAMEYLKMVKKHGLINYRLQSYLLLAEVKKYLKLNYSAELKEAKKFATILRLKPLLNRIKKFDER